MENTALQSRPAQRQGLALVEPNGDNKLARLNMRELKELASVFMESGAFPDIKHAAQAMVKVIAGQELGFSPIVSMTGIHFFQGKVELSSTLKASLIKDSGRYEYKVLEHTDDACEIAFFQKVGNELVSCGVPVRYTMADAAKAGLTGKDNWKKYQKDMLFAAVIRQGSRRYCADVLRGVTPDEDIDIDSNIDVSALENATADNQVVDAVPVEMTAREKTESKITQLCSDLNAAGDDIKWTKKTLAEYAETLNQKPLTEHSDEEYEFLAEELEGRLASINSAKSEIDGEYV